MMPRLDGGFGPNGIYPFQHNAMRAARLPQATTGLTLAKRTLGVVGLGRVGRLVAGYGRAFGMKVLAWSPSLTEERARDVGAERADLDQLLQESDVVSLHTALVPETHNLIGRRELALMKRSAILINTARGPIVHEAALLDALD